MALGESGTFDGQISEAPNGGARAFNFQGYRIQADLGLQFPPRHSQPTGGVTLEAARTAAQARPRTHGVARTHGGQARGQWAST